MGNFVKEVGGYIIFSAAGIPDDKMVKRVTRRVNGGGLGIITGNISVIYNDMDRRVEIEKKYGLKPQRKFAQLEMVSYSEDELYKMLQKYQGLQKEDLIKSVRPEVVEYHFVPN